MFRLLRVTPPNGWRAVAWELLIVTLGVLMALGAQQLVEAFRDRAEAREGRDAIRGELEVNMARLASRFAIRPCVDRRLAEIQALLDDSEATGLIGTPRWIGRPQYWTMLTARWDASAQAGRAALLPADELAEYGQMYSWMRNIHAEMVIEQSDWAQLRTLEHLRRIRPEGLLELRGKVEDARYRRWRINQQTMLLLPAAARLELKAIGNDIPAPRSICVPMDTPRDRALRLSGSPYGEP